MIRELRGDRLQQWMDAVQADDLPPLHSFVAGIRLDQDAVVAGLTSRRSSGPVEGHVNPLKMQRRSYNTAIVASLPIDIEAIASQTQARLSGTVLSPPTPIEYWESERTRPSQWQPTPAELARLQRAFEGSFATTLDHPFRSAVDIRRAQFHRIQELVEMAYDEIPVYREKYKAVGFRPTDLRSWDDYTHIPTITKGELIDAFPDGCISRRFRDQHLFATRSSGSSGHTLLIRVDLEAVVDDTLQGVRQFILQSDGRYEPDSLLAHVYTIPWWFHSIGDAYRTAFVSSVIPTRSIARILRSLNPSVISCYPTNLEALLASATPFASERLQLVVTHSESSSRLARQNWGQCLAAPVRDEYSSEEATRIALELPCGHYHVCEDSVNLEVVDPTTLQPLSPGQSGLAVVTNLLNEAMPFIRYVQGDRVSRPEEQAQCGVGWSQLASVDGRMNDSFINREHKTIPAGSILDLTYRWMFDRDVYVREFLVVQVAVDRIRLYCSVDHRTPEKRLRSAIDHLEDLLELCFEHPVDITLEIMEQIPVVSGKRRPIRCAIEK